MANSNLGQDGGGKGYRPSGGARYKGRGKPDTYGEVGSMMPPGNPSCTNVPGGNDFKVPGDPQAYDPTPKQVSGYNPKQPPEAGIKNSNKA